MGMFSRKPKFGLPKLKTDFILFTGGLDTETPKWEAKPGTLHQSLNYEIGIENGYQDITGYERFDGNPSPSDATYSLLNVTITGEFSDGDTITQLVSGATAVVVAVVTTDTPNYLVITKVTGTFDDSNDLQVSSVTEGTSLSIAIENGATSSLLRAQYKNLAADEYRTDISAIPGSGDVSGLTRLNNIKYGFRNNVGGTATDIYKSSGAGWVNVPLNYSITFTTGSRASGEPAEGETITVGSNSATVLRVVTESGSWTGGTAVGRVIIDAGSPGAIAAAGATFSGGGTCTVSVAEAAITLLPDGSYEFDIDQFGGEASARRIYGCDSVNNGFEFDGTVYVPIVTGMTVDTPEHVIVHKNHLFFGFKASAQHSGINTPYIWSPIFGAAELATGDQITAFSSEPGAQLGATLGIYNRNTTHMLYGSDSASWNLVRFKDELGAFARTVQQIGSTLFQDDRGLTSLRAVQEYGNFQSATLSGQIQSLFNSKKSLATNSCIVRDKNQYRIFYSDGTALYMTMDGYKTKGIMPVTLAHTVTSMYSLEDNDGNEEIMFGSSDGFVYQMEKGTSFDGADIDALMFFQFSYSKFLNWIKKYLGIAFEASGDGYAAFNFSYQLDYNTSQKAQPGGVDNELEFSQANWDIMTWDEFIWDGQTLTSTTNKLRGSGENISLVISKSSDYMEPLKLSGALMRFALRRLKRE